MSVTAIHHTQNKPDKNQNTNNFNKKLEQLIRKCKNTSCLALITGDMNASSGKRQEENCVGRYSKVLKNHSEDYLVNICKTNNLTTLFFQIHVFHTREVIWPLCNRQE